MLERVHRGATALLVAGGGLLLAATGIHALIGLPASVLRIATPAGSALMVLGGVAHLLPAASIVFSPSRALRWSRLALALGLVGAVLVPYLVGRPESLPSWVPLANGRSTWDALLGGAFALVGFGGLRDAWELRQHAAWGPWLSRGLVLAAGGAFAWAYGLAGPERYWRYGFWGGIALLTAAIIAWGWGARRQSADPSAVP